MTPREKQAWLLNLGLVALFLAATLLARQFSAPASAAGGSWDTDGMMINTTESDADRLVILDTDKKAIMVYRTEGSGTFRLMSARSYMFDGDLEDASGVAEIENRNGVTFMRACELLAAKQKAQP